MGVAVDGDLHGQLSGDLRPVRSGVKRGRAVAWPRVPPGGTLCFVRVWTAFIGGGLLAAAAFGVYSQAQVRLERDWGILVGEQVPPIGDDVESWLAARQRTVAARRVTLITDGWAGETTWGELGVSLDVESTARAARLAA